MSGSSKGMQDPVVPSLPASSRQDGLKQVAMPILTGCTITSTAIPPRAYFARRVGRLGFRGWCRSLRQWSPPHSATTNTNVFCPGYCCSRPWATIRCISITCPVLVTAMLHMVPAAGRMLGVVHKRAHQHGPKEWQKYLATGCGGNRARTNLHHL